MEVASGEKPVNLLSIDGGFSGLIALFVLKEIFQRLKYDLKSEEDVLPCDWFDMMIGTDTGGIVALLLGPLRMTLEQAITAYIQLQKYIHTSTPPLSDLERTENSKDFKEAFVEVLKSMGFQADSAMQASTAKALAAKTIVCTTESSRPTALRLLRSYLSHEEGIPPCTILQAACATISSHHQFNAVAIGEGYDPIELRSALVGFANPTSELLREAVREFGGDTWAATIINIGGRFIASDPEDPTPTAKLEEILKDTDAVHQDLYHRLHQLNIYFRFDIPYNPIVVGDPRSVYREVQRYKSDGRVSKCFNEAVRSIHLRQRVKTLSDLTSVRQVEIGLKPRPSIVPYLVGRHDILSALRSTHLHDSPSQSDVPIISVLTGLGGSGKTQISLKFALEYEEKCPEAPVYFVNGSSEAALKVDLEAIIRSQGTEFRSKTFNDAIIWLASKSKRWLMIIDNVDDPSITLFPLIPKSRYGHVIVASRDSTRLGLAELCNRHRIGDLEQQAAVELLLRLSSCPASDSNKLLASSIATELGYLPLALAHAGAYISIHGGMSSYLETYQQSRKEMLEHLPPGLPSDYNLAVAATIEMSFTKLPQQSRDILCLLSHFQIDSIAESIIVRAAERRFGHIACYSSIKPGPEIEQCAEALMGMFCPNGRWSRRDFNELILPCIQSSLLQSGENERTGRCFSMHPLVQSWIQSQTQRNIFPSQQDLFVRLIASSITIGKAYEYLEFNQTLRPHIQIIDEKTVRYIGDRHAFSVILRENGDNILAMDYMKSCLDEEKKILGEEHPDTLASIHDLSIYYSGVGMCTEALEMGTKVMELRRRTLGSEHSETLASMHNLSVRYSEAGRYTDALEMGLEVLELHQKLLGSDHPDTLSSMHNVSICYSRAGRYTEGLEMASQVMGLRQKILGREHPSTLQSMSNVSTRYLQIGRYTEALEMALEAMKLRQKVLGSEHPDTLQSMHNVSVYYFKLGKYEEALQSGLNSLNSRQKVLGLEHPDTQQSIIYIELLRSFVCRAQYSLVNLIRRQRFPLNSTTEKHKLTWI
ncbi:hypothetical protein CPB86DRAFT_740622 [Serendipita vermifera]|nr:hypothetical protein CPB86DRAFT_740622 [Serendipita vermifera]